MGFIRVKLIDVQQAEEWKKNSNGKFEPYCAIHIKEAVQTPGRGVQLVQKKRTVYPEWNKCFDTHLYPGRVISVVVMEKPNIFRGETTIGVQFLVDQCQKDCFSSLWVSCLLIPVSSREFVNWKQRKWIFLVYITNKDAICGIYYTLNIIDYNYYFHFLNSLKPNRLKLWSFK